MEKYFYPAIFHKAEEGGFWISFPDFPECLTQGDDLSDAYSMASDALGLCISDLQNEKKTLPAPTYPDNLSLEKDSYLVVIQFDLDEYKRKFNNKAVKKTLSIPQWLNEKAMAQGVNFSQVLQEALIQKVSYSYSNQENMIASEAVPKYSV